MKRWWLWFFEAFMSALSGAVLGSFALKLVDDRWFSPGTWLWLVPLCFAIGALNAWARGRA